VLDCGCRGSGLIGRCARLLGRRAAPLFFGRAGTQPLDAGDDRACYLGCVDAFQPFLQNALDTPLRLW